MPDITPTDGVNVLDPSAFRELVSGRRRGVTASLTRCLLAAIELPYSLAVRWRNRRYDTGRAEVTRVDVPVVSVGNITLGGTGKTPAVEWLARWFASKGLRVALVSRGYGAKTGQLNDEALELAQKLPGVPHVQDADRVRGAHRAITEHGAQLILLDDAFQHRRIARDLDIVLVDALEPFGYEHVFPRGTLREPLEGWRRADVVILTRAEQADEPRRAEIRRRVSLCAPNAVWVEATHAPIGLLWRAGRDEPLETLRDKSIAAFCGIGNPAGFWHALESCGYRVAARRTFADHHAYSESDLVDLARWSDPLEVASVVCTQKDMVKVAAAWCGEKPLFALNSQLQILAGQSELEAALAKILPHQD